MNTFKVGDRVKVVYNEKSTSWVGWPYGHSFFIQNIKPNTIIYERDPIILEGLNKFGDLDRIHPDFVELDKHYYFNNKMKGIIND